MNRLSSPSLTAYKSAVASPTVSFRAVASPTAKAIAATAPALTIASKAVYTVAPKTVSPSTSWTTIQPSTTAKMISDVLSPNASIAARPASSYKVISAGTKSPTIAPDFISMGPAKAAPAVPPEVANPGLTQPAAMPYAPDATWEPFAQAPPTGTTGSGAAVEIDPFDEAPVEAFVPLEPDAVVTADGPKPGAPTTAKVVEPSWFDKLLGIFGLSRKAAVSATMAGEAAAMATMSQSEAAAQLVRRARNGDQNAMAMIICVRDAAGRGNAKAKMSAKLMLKYAQAHPVDETTSAFGVEHVIPRMTPDPSDPATRAAVALSHGPPLSNPRIEEFVRHARFGAEELNAFEHGLAGRAMRNPRPSIQRANKMGGLMAHARKLQAVRMKDSPVRKFDKNIGWELGEDID